MPAGCEIAVGATLKRPKPAGIDEAEFPAGGEFENGVRVF